VGGCRRGVSTDLERLRRPDLELAYRCTAAGPPAIRSQADVVAAAPHVVRVAMAAAGEGFDAVIVDCTDDPGVAAARRVAGVPVIGAGEALRVAIADAPQPVRLFSGDELRRLPAEDVLRLARGAHTVALGATGFSYLVDQFAALEGVGVVLDPLDVAAQLCLAALRDADDDQPSTNRWSIGSPRASADPARRLS
jgi:Asp/Glu/hydantoin racemase